MLKANNLKEIIRYFDSQTPLTPEDAEQWQAFYTETERNKIDHIITALVSSPIGHKILFGGHPGNGKSTELNKLVFDERIKQQFVVIKFDAKELLDVNDIDITELLLVISLKILEFADRHKLTPDDYFTQEFDKLEGFFRKKLKVEEVRSRLSQSSLGAEAKISLSAKIPLVKMGSNFYAKIRGQHEFRKIVRKTYRPRLTELVDLVNDLFIDISEKNRSHNILLIADGLDRAPIEPARKLYMDIIRKKEELQLPLLFAHIRLRDHQGVLIFLTCTTADVEHYLIQTLRDELEEEYAFETIPLHIQDYAPFTAIWHRPAGTKTLLIFNAFPFEAFYQEPDAFKKQIDNLCANLNLNRDFIPEKKLKCIFILPLEVEHRIALTASDFYHFKSYTAAFTDDAAFHRGITEAEQGDEGRGDRIAFLLRRLKKAAGAKQLAPLHFELGSLYDDISNINQALHHLQKAQELYRLVEDERNLNAALGNIGLIYSDLGQPEDALKYHKEALVIAKKIDYLQGRHQPWATSVLCTAIWDSRKKP